MCKETASTSVAETSLTVNDAVVTDEQFLEELEQHSASPRSLALLRIRYQGCLSERFVNVLLRQKSKLLRPKDDEDDDEENNRYLDAYATCVALDPMFAVEMGQAGAHTSLLLPLCAIGHEVACSIASASPHFPMRMHGGMASSGTKSSLPLAVSFPPHISSPILLQQVSTQRQAAQADVGFGTLHFPEEFCPSHSTPVSFAHTSVLWPAAVGLAQWLAKHLPLLSPGASILELGAGCGLVGLAAAALFPEASKVVLTDHPDYPTVLHNLKANVQLNSSSISAGTISTDRMMHPNKKAAPHEQERIQVQSLDFSHFDSEQFADFDVILAADVVCQPSDAMSLGRALETLLNSRKNNTAYVLSGSATHRYGVNVLPQAFRNLDWTCETISADSMQVEAASNGNSSVWQQTAGYVPGMEFVLYTVRQKQHPSPVQGNGIDAAQQLKCCVK